MLLLLLLVLDVTEQFCMHGNFLVNDIEQLDRIGSLIEIRIHADTQQPLYDGVSRLALPVKVQIVWHINPAHADVLLDEIGVILRVLAVVRVALCRHVVQTAAQRPDVRLVREHVIRADLEDLWRRAYHDSV
jgi:hypothetical protein